MRVPQAWAMSITLEIPGCLALGVFRDTITGSVLRIATKYPPLVREFPPGTGVADYCRCRSARAATEGTIKKRNRRGGLPDIPQAGEPCAPNRPQIRGGGGGCPMEDLRSRGDTFGAVGLAEMDDADRARMTPWLARPA